MKRRRPGPSVSRTALAITAAFVLAWPTPAAARPARQEAPNIVLIVADDLGYSDLGAFGGEIRTPNLDRLARQGTRFTNFHATPACSPTRAELLTGVDHHRTGFGTFTELMRDNQRGRPGYEGQLSRELLTLAERLRQAGYFTAMAGKWHLGTAPWADPSARGFQRTFALVGGGANHFGRGRDGSAQFQETYTRDGQKVTSLPADFYSSDAFTDYLLDFIGEAPAEQSVFAYLAFTAPHYPLQAPAQNMARYRGRYDGGWAALYKARFAAVRRLGLVPSARFDAALYRRLQQDWAALAPEDRALAARKMEVYAAMVDRMDEDIGRLVTRLKAMGRYDNTIFLFLSDNGPEGTELEHSRNYSAVGQAILAGSDNSLAALGSARSFSWYGPGWAHAGAAPFAMFKHYPYEGGIRVPAILHLPQASPRICRDYVSVLAVTASVAGWSRPVTTPAAPASTCGSASALVINSPKETGWELWGRRGLRSGEWMAVLVPDLDGPDTWRLFNIAADPSQTRDLARRHPALLRQMIEKWDHYAKLNGVVLPDRTGL